MATSIVNEYNTSNICSIAFFNLFPYGFNCPLTKFPFEPEHKKPYFNMTYRIKRILNQVYIINQNYGNQIRKKLYWRY